MGEYTPFEVAIERGFTMHNKSTQVIYRCHGVINELLHKYPQFYYPPTTVKKIVAGNGRASKEELEEIIASKYPNLSFDNDDESDAVGVGLSHLIEAHKVTL